MMRMRTILIATTILYCCCCCCFVSAAFCPGKVGHSFHPRTKIIQIAVSTATAAATAAAGAGASLDNDTPANTGNDKTHHELDSSSSWSRREALSITLRAGMRSTAALSFLTTSWKAPTAAEAAAAEAERSSSSDDRPIVVMGAGGRTGMILSQTLASENKNVVLMTRSGKDPFQNIGIPSSTASRMTSYPTPMDVRSFDTVLQAIREIKPSAIVFAASASKKGGTAAEVDDVGVGNVVKAAKSVGARFVLISALALDRPDSKGYQITNELGGNLNGIMDAKYQGEQRVRNELGRGTGDYIIVRPGVLLNGKSKNGPLGMELNQGDTIGGGLSRDELAGVVIGALQTKKRGITVEAYRKSTATALQPNFVVPSGKELVADSFVGLFDHAMTD